MAKLFEDDNGNLSMGRVTQFMIVGAVLFNWMLITFKTGQAVGLGYQEVALLTAAQGGKVLQKFAELKK